MEDLHFKLKRPIVYGGQEFKELTIKRPKVKDFNKFKALHNDDYFFSNLIVQAEFFIKECGSLPEAALLEMDHAADYTALLEKMTNFLANDQWENGAT